MEARTAAARAAGAAKLGVATVGVAVPPLLLAALIGNPLPSLPIDWGRAIESIQAGLVPSSVWVNVLAVVAWVAWAALVLVLAVDVVAVARNRPSSRAVPRWVRYLAQTLVAAAISLAGPGQQPLAAATAGTSFIAAAAPVIPSAQAVPAEGETAVEGRLFTVGEGDSWGGFAADVLGDAELGPQLREANLGRYVGDSQTITEATAFVEPGWRLLIPTHLETKDGATPQTAPTSNDEKAGMWEVEPGDHFWGIAEITLSEAWGRAPTDAEIAPYWQQLVDANSDRLLPPGDPNLIYPDQEFALPTPPGDPAAPDHSSGAATRGGWREAIEGPQTVEPDEPAPSAHTSEAPRGGPGWQQAIEGEAAREHAPETTSDAEDRPRTAFGFPIGLAQGAAATSVLAAGAVATLRWRRRTALQQRPPGLRLPTPLPEAQTEEARLAAAAAPDPVLDDLAAMLGTIPANTHPALVTVGDDGEIMLLFDEQDELPVPSAPWTLAYDGASGPVGWRATLGSRGPDRSFGLPLLVTLGRTGTATVLANVAAMGTLTLAGDEGWVRSRQRTMSLEIATSRVSVPVEVAIAGDDRLNTLDRIRLIDDPAREVRLSMEEIEQDIVLDDRTPRLLVCHRGVDPPSLPGELRGMVGVVTAEPSSDGWLVDLEDDRTGRLHLPGGGTVTLALPDIDPDVVDDELTRLVQPATEPVDPEPEPVQAGEPSSNGHRSATVAVRAEPAWCEVRILGPVDVMVDGEPVEGLTPRLLEVFTYLVTHDGVSKERLDAAVWADEDAPAGTQRVLSALTKIRGVLGDGPDGEPLLPRRHGDELIELSPHVGCDLDRALARLDLAHDLPAEARGRELAAALDLVRGEPFQGRTYTWATDVAQHAIVKLQDAAVEAARTLREAGDLESAEGVIERGHKLLAGNGWLFLEQAQLEKARGHPERASKIYEQYRYTLDAGADETAGTVASIPLEIELAFRQVVS